MASLAHNIALYAWGNPARIEMIEEARDAAFESILSGMGKEVQSTTANQVTVAFFAGSSLQSMFDTLSEALAILNSGMFPPKRKQVYFPPPDYNNI